MQAPQIGRHGNVGVQLDELLPHSAFQTLTGTGPIGAYYCVTDGSVCWNTCDLVG